MSGDSADFDSLKTLVSIGGILLVDKPAGITSFGVVNHIRKALVREFPLLDSRKRRVKGGPRPPRFKCGHAGTLDPLATGLMVILVGKGSRLSPFLTGLDKSYSATIRFGVATDTLDSDGLVVGTADVPATTDIINDKLKDFIGRIDQVPPVYSALKKNGQPLYKLARKGQDVPEPEPRPVTINKLEVTAVRWGIEASNGFLAEDGLAYEIDLLVDCGSGTYIRSLARDLAGSAGTMGHIHRLRRLTIGPFDVDNVVGKVMDQDGRQLVVDLDSLVAALPHIPFLVLNAEQAASLRQGIQPRAEWLEGLSEELRPIGKSGLIFRMIGPGNDLVAVGQLDTTTGEPQIAAVIPEEMESRENCSDETDQDK